MSAIAPPRPGDSVGGRRGRPEQVVSEPVDEYHTDPSYAVEPRAEPEMIGEPERLGAWAGKRRQHARQEVGKAGIAIAGHGPVGVRGRHRSARSPGE